jgi:hypothetical protein
MYLKTHFREHNLMSTAITLIRLAVVGLNESALIPSDLLAMIPGDTFDSNHVMMPLKSRTEIRAGVDDFVAVKAHDFNKVQQPSTSSPQQAQ